METLDLTVFENAVNSLITILERWNSDKTDDVIRDSMIQRFEYTFSFSVKMMNRFLNLQSHEGINTLTFNEIIRKSNQYGIIKSNLETWDDYRQKRNMTSHTYNENVAKDVVAIIPVFKDEAEYLLNKLKLVIMNFFL